MTLVGLVLGAGAAAAAVVAVSKALTGSFVPYVPLASALVIVGLVVGLSAIATLVPAAALLLGSCRDDA